MNLIKKLMEKKQDNPMDKEVSDNDYRQHRINWVVRFYEENVDGLISMLAYVNRELGECAYDSVDCTCLTSLKNALLGFAEEVDNLFEGSNGYIGRYNSLPVENKKFGSNFDILCKKPKESIEKINAIEVKKCSAVESMDGSGKTEVYELLKRKLYKYKSATLEMEYLLPAKYHQLSEADELITDVQDGIKTSYESLKSKLDEIYETIYTNN